MAATRGGHTTSGRARTGCPTVTELGASNAEVIAEFRGNHGKVGGFFADDSLLLLTTIGRKSDNEHTNPLSYVEDEGQLVVMGADLSSSIRLGPQPRRQPHRHSGDWKRTPRSRCNRIGR